MKFEFTGQLKTLIEKAHSGNSLDVDYIMNHLNIESTLAITRYVDFALSLVENTDGIERIKYYLFNGTLIQRNYASLFLNRLGEWKPVKEAYEKGLIDKIQAYSR
ncbi:hypothetical protein ACE01N_07855 [Saccharicrinis sp. FJH2]|uniref:hypothetical protein n=1 Tax=Saccharicrinis sp. FJH65 TaxID=3344659 RepID=UPI0035F43931